MNHFATDRENRRLDEIALDAMEQLDPAHLLATVTEHNISMCGVLPAVIVMETLRQLGGLRPANASAMPPAPTSPATPAASSATPAFCSVDWAPRPGWPTKAESDRAVPLPSKQHAWLRKRWYTRRSSRIVTSILDVMAALA